MNEVYLKHQQKIDDFIIPGTILKQVSSDISPYLDGCLEGILCEVINENHAEVYKLIDDSKDEILRAQLFLRWTSEQLSPIYDDRKLRVTPMIPPGKSKGIYVTQFGARILVALLA